MSNNTSPTIDTYIHELFLPRDNVLEATLQHAHESDLRSIQDKGARCKPLARGYAPCATLSFTATHVGGRF